MFYVPNQRLPAVELYRVISAIVEFYPDRAEMPPVQFLTTAWL